MRPNKTNFGLSFGHCWRPKPEREKKKRRREEEKKKKKYGIYVWIHDFEYGNHVLVWRLLVYGNYDDFVWKIYRV